MKIRKIFNYFKNIKLVALSLLLFVNFIVFILLFVEFNNSTNNFYNNLKEELVNENTISLNIYSQMAEAVYDFKINRPEVKELFYKGVYASSEKEKNIYRKKLYEELEFIYGIITKYSFRQLHFHEYNNKSFLRFHRPNKFGDDLTGVRSSVEYVNREKKPIFGFEEGRIFNGYRFVFPVFYSSNKYIGSVEVSVSFKTIIDQYKNRFGKKAEFILSKKQVQKKVFNNEKSNYKDWFIDDRFVLDKAIAENCILHGKINLKDQKKIRSVLTKNENSTDPFYVKVKISNQSKILVFLPIKNFENQNTAFLFVVNDVKKLHSLYYSYASIFFVLVVLISITIMFLFYYINTQKKFRHMAMYDNLTGVFSRAILFEKLSSERERYLRYGKVFSIVMLDIDHFKKVNDDYGHQNGDLVLQKTSSTLKNVIRKSDSIGRYGGEEFIIILPETNAEQAVVSAEKMRSSVEKVKYKNMPSITISCGVSLFNDENMSVEDLIANADEKLYEAKKSGRNCVKCFVN